MMTVPTGYLSAMMSLSVESVESAVAMAPKFRSFTVPVYAVQ